jgi:flagellar hook-associated protein 1 FlgK
MSNFFSLEIGKRSVLMHQTALSITGHNLANANTPGYTRQVPDIVTTSPWHAPAIVQTGKAGQLGTGVDIRSIQRIRDAFLDTQIRNENKTAGYWNELQTTMDRLEVILNEPSEDGLRAVMDVFWEAWQDLSVNPESQAVRSVVAQRGMAMAEAFRHTYRQLVELREDVNASVAIKVKEINDIAVNIADLNQQILAISISGKQPNDLLDKRDLLLDELSRLADVKIYNDNNGMVAVQLGDRVLVEGVHYNTLSTIKDDEGMHMVIWSDTLIRAKIGSGELRGLLDARGRTNHRQEANPSEYREVIPNMINDLNALAKTLVIKINEIHRGGFSLNNKSAIPDGKDFFNMPDQDPLTFKNWAEFMNVNREIQDDVKNIAAASHRTWVKDNNQQYIKDNFGDGSNALKIAELKHNLNSFDYAVRTEGLDIIFDDRNTAYHEPLTFYIGADGVPVQIDLEPPANYRDMQSLVDDLQAKLDQLGLPITVRCEGKGVSGNELVFCSNKSRSLEVIFPNTGISDLRAEGLQHGEYAISTEVGTAPGINDARVSTLQQYLQGSANNIFNGAILNVAPNCQVNASIMLEITSVNTITRQVIYRYCSHEYDIDGNYTEVQPGSFTLTYGGGNTTVTIGSVTFNTADLDIARLSTGQLMVGDKAVLNVTAGNNGILYQGVEVAYNYNYHKPGEPEDCTHRFIFNEHTLDGTTTNPKNFDIKFYTLNTNPLSQDYGDSYNGYVGITNGDALATKSPAAFISSYYPYQGQTGDIETFMVQHVTTDDFWRSVAADTGVLSQEAQRMVKNQEILLSELDNKKESISGVSLDEEMTNMIKFQHAYNAAARYITAIDEAIDVIVNRMGVVGR